MPISQSEFDAMMDDAAKWIEGDLQWGEDPDHSPAVEFRAEVRSDTGYPLSVRGRYNQLAGTLSYTLLHRTTGRVYALDLGADHHNPTCQRVGEKHKHRWTDQYADKQAYIPEDITAPAEDLAGVWQQFCAEARISHRGKLQRLPTTQPRLGDFS
jgi:hypothetical protein